MKGRMVYIYLLMIAVMYVHEQKVSLLLDYVLLLAPLYGWPNCTSLMYVDVFVYKNVYTDVHRYMFYACAC